MTNAARLIEKPAAGRLRLIAKDAPPHRDLCTDCGVSRMANPKACASACQFIAPDYPKLERRAHGRVREEVGDETFFGVIRGGHRARYTGSAPGAQWTGITRACSARAVVMPVHWAPGAEPV